MIQGRVYCGVDEWLPVLHSPRRVLPTMLTLLKRRDTLDCILIETSGLALPKPLVKAFRWPEIRNAATVDAVITVDCEAVAAFASDPEAVDVSKAPESGA